MTLLSFAKRSICRVAASASFRCAAIPVLCTAALLVGISLTPMSGGAHAESLSEDQALRNEVEAMPSYVPSREAHGTLRLWGHGSPTKPFMRRLVARWEAGFARYQPHVTFVDKMYGTASAIGALYADAGDLAIMGEEIFPFEVDAYRKVRHTEPASVEVATGSLDVRNFDFAQMVFVNKANPLSSITLAQLDAVFGVELRGGAPALLRTWDQLGLNGSMAGHKIQPYGWSFDNDFWFFLEATIFGESHRLNTDMREYAHIHRDDGSIYDAGAQILEALARDPDGIAISNIRYANPDVKPLAIARRDGEPAVAASRATLVSRAYPLTRMIPIAFNRDAGRPLPAPAAEFLRYILSKEGQRDILDDGEYLPLNHAGVLRQRQILDDAK